MWSIIVEDAYKIGFYDIFFSISGTIKPPTSLATMHLFKKYVE